LQNFDVKKETPSKADFRGGDMQWFIRTCSEVIFQAHQIPERSFSYVVMMVTTN